MTDVHKRLIAVLSFALLLVVPTVAERLVLSDKVIAAVEQKYGQAARKRVTEWKALMDSSGGHSEREKLKLVNDFFNQIPFVSDADHWGKEDYWATPIEMLGTNGGDCEDFSIAKYFTLAQVGVPVRKLQITYVKAQNWNPVSQAHMVLAYYESPNAVPVILDNLIPEIRSASVRTDLTPVYSFNGEGLWLAKERGLGKNVGSSDRLKLWRDLMERMGREADSR